MIAATFHGARVLRDGALEQAPLSIADGFIVTAAQPHRVDLSGFLVLPGIVDLHGDAFERHLAPRRGAMTDLGAGFAALDADLGANGISTAVLAQFYSWEGGMRRPDFAERMSQTLTEVRAQMLTDMRLQLRFETHMLEDYPRAEALIARAGIEYVVYNDHLPHAALAAGKKPPRLTGQALKSRRSPEAHLALMQHMHARGAEVPGALAALSERLMARGVRLGSHDDATFQARAMFRAMGARISEFPETREAAHAAHEAGDPVILGAPNVMRGASHKGMVSAGDLLREGVGDVLVSDYHYAALHRAALKLWAEGLMDLPCAWALISENPARVLGLGDRGALTPDQRADLVVLDPETGRIGATICAGRISFAAGEVARRMMAV